MKKLIFSLLLICSTTLAEDILSLPTCDIYVTNKTDLVVTELLTTKGFVVHSDPRSENDNLFSGLGFLDTLKVGDVYFDYHFHLKGCLQVNTHSSIQIKRISDDQKNTVTLFAKQKLNKTYCFPSICPTRAEKIKMLSDEIFRDLFEYVPQCVVSNPLTSHIDTLPDKPHPHPHLQNPILEREDDYVFVE